MAHKKSGGSSSNGRDSDGRRLGVKKFRRREGPRWQHHHPSARHEVLAGRRRRIGKDHTLFALIEGAVKFVTKKHNRTYVTVAPKALPAE